MACPDEDTFARFVEGLLPPRETAAIERHVDGCPRCADLAAAFGRLYAPSSTAPPRVDESGLVREALGLSVVLHVAWAVVIARAPAALAALAPAGLAAAYRGYATIWGPVGAGWAILAAAALGRRWRGGRGAAMAHAALALPSVVLTPLAAFVLFALRRRDIGRGAAS
jgi:anti-sigma factor RsiW